MSNTMTLDDLIAEFEERQQKYTDVVDGRRIGIGWAINRIRDNRAALEAGMRPALTVETKQLKDDMWQSVVRTKTGTKLYGFIGHKSKESVMRMASEWLQESLGLRADFVEESDD